MQVRKAGADFTNEPFLGLEDMMTRAHIIMLLGVVLALCHMGFGQTLSETSQEKTILYMPRVPAFEELPELSPDVIRRELLDTNTVRLIARHAGISDAALSTITIKPLKKWRLVRIHSDGTYTRTFDILGKQLTEYARIRGEGHTRSYGLELLTNRTQVLDAVHPDLRLLATNQHPLLLSWLVKAKEGTTTNKAGTVVSFTIHTTYVNGQAVTNEIKHIPAVDEVCRWVEYRLVDGAIAWTYRMSFKADGVLDNVMVTKSDAKEYDPKYSKIIQEVENEVEAIMKKNGSYEKFGSVHGFWNLKRAKLKARGIKWLSPSQLNLNACFD